MTLQDCSATLIDDIGKTVTLRKEGNDADNYDPATGVMTNSTTDYSTKAMLLNYRDNQFDGEIIRRGDRKAVLKAKGLAVVPEPQDLIVIGSSEWRIVNVRQIEESDTDVVYICQLRT